jgi:hypothetical protein
MPSTDVSIALKAAWHQNGQRTWTMNDIYDIDALALATPYCDVVVTEKACHHILSTAKMNERMNTSLLYRLRLMATSFALDPLSLIPVIPFYAEIQGMRETIETPAKDRISL